MKFYGTELDYIITGGYIILTFNKSQISYHSSEEQKDAFERFKL